jgi:hypothetical protein
VDTECTTTFVSIEKWLRAENGVLCVSRAPPHAHNEVRSYLDERLRNSWIGRGGHMKWPPRTPDLTSIDLILWVFVKDNIYVAQLPTTLHSSRHGWERPVEILIRKFSTTCGRRLNIGLMLLELLVALTLNFINDKLRFMKLFSNGLPVGTCSVSVNESSSD